MTTFNPDFPVTAPASVDLSTFQYCAAAMNSSAQIAVCAAGAMPVGVLQNDPLAGEPARVDKRGLQKAKAGGTIAAAARVAVGANGVFKTAASGEYVVGTAWEAAVVGDIFQLNWEPLGKEP